MSHEAGLDHLGRCSPQAKSHAITSPLTSLVVLDSWENKDIYAAAIRSLRLRELQNMECVTAVRAGLGSIIPLQLLTTLSPLEMELRTCGLPYVNLEFLKVGSPALPDGPELCPHHRCPMLWSTCSSCPTLPGVRPGPLTTGLSSPGPHHVPGGADGDRPAHRALLGGSGDVHPGGTVQVHQVRLQSGAHPLHLPLQGRRS